MTDMNNEKKECTFTWFIENYSFSCKKNGEAFFSPEFTADGFGNTLWFLNLYPRGYSEETKGCISFFLHRSLNHIRPENFPLKYELAVLAPDGSALFSKEIEHTFQIGKGCGIAKIPMANLEKADYLPGDILSLRCKLWNGEGNLKQVKHISARTCIGIEQFSFLHVINDFSALEPNQNMTISIRSPSEKVSRLSSSMYFSGDSFCNGKIIAEIKPSNIHHILSKCEIYLLDTSGSLMKCGEADNRSDAERKDIQKLPLSITRQLILKRKTEFLPDDKLSLLCNCTFSTGVKYPEIEIIRQEVPPVAIVQINNHQNEDVYNAAEKLSACSSALDDFESAYKNQLLTDVLLKTQTKSFPAHKIVLCARSPVFKAIITNEMKEKITDCIQIDDLEIDVVQHLLSFLYSDKLENLQWELAIKLYDASDKYDIERPKVICSSFLVDNLTTSTASELLLLADIYSDSGLQKAVEDFIFKHDEQVFNSPEWENLIKTNAELVSRTMILKYKRQMISIQQ